MPVLLNLSLNFRTGLRSCADPSPGFRSGTQLRLPHRRPEAHFHLFPQGGIGGADAIQKRGSFGEREIKDISRNFPGLRVFFSSEINIGFNFP
jgi:hypothetical protein